MRDPESTERIGAGLVHGLLRLRSERASGVATERLERGLAQLRAHAKGSGRRLPKRLLVSLAVAAQVALVVGVFTLRGPSAYALVRSAVEVESGFLQRRHRIEAVGVTPQGEESVLLEGSLEQAGPQLVALELAAPQGNQRLRMGRTARGVWMQMGDREPTWSLPEAPMAEVLGHPAAMLGSLDVFVDTLTRNYELEIIPGGKGSSVRHVRATRREPHGVQPAVVDLWIDRETRRARRMELSWAPREGQTMADWHALLLQDPNPATLLLVAPRLVAGGGRSLVRLTVTCDTPRLIGPADFEPR